jgi:hypothetical protein
MSKIKYCPLCKREVQVRSNFSWIVFFILIWFAVVPAIIYWIICHKKRCPICGYKF